MRSTHLGSVMILLSTLALAPTLAAAAPPQPAVVEGEVVEVDKASSRVTVRSNDGQIHEFEASAETLEDLKPGDRIEARKRSSGK